jgi:hypothetical protein
MTTVYFPSTWLYRHCAEWLKDRDYSDSQVVRQLKQQNNSYYEFNGYHPGTTYIIIEGNRGGKLAAMDIANQFITERFLK